MVEKKEINWTYVVLIALLVITVGYIAVSEFGNWRDTRDAEVYQQGMNDATTQIAETTTECQTISLRTQDNETVTLASMECVQEQLQQGGQEQLPSQEETSENDSESEELL